MYRPRESSVNTLYAVIGRPGEGTTQKAGCLDSLEGVDKASGGSKHIEVSAGTAAKLVPHFDQHVHIVQAKDGPT